MVEKGCVRLSHNIQLQLNGQCKAGPWLALITEKQRILPAGAELNSSHTADAADSKNK
jgi:hypothetical protein